MATVPIDSLLEAGVHFGHRVSRWNPKMAPYIYGKRNLIHIIDLKMTLRGLIRATHFLRRLSAQGQQILFVGTKRQARGLVERAARSLDMPYVCDRWIGGLLTNNAVVKTRLNRLFELEQMEADGSINMYKKKEISSLRREKRRILRNLDGVRNMDSLPGALVVVDPNRERTSVLEANRLGLPVVAFLDTDCDPNLVDIPIPGNDDAIRSIQAILEPLVQAVAEGRRLWQEEVEAAEKVRREQEVEAERQREMIEEARRRYAAEKAATEAAVPGRAAPPGAEPVSRETGAVPAPPSAPPETPGPEEAPDRLPPQVARPGPDPAVSFEPRKPEVAPDDKADTTSKVTSRPGEPGA